MCPPQECDATVDQQSAGLVACKAGSRSASVAVWDIPSPVVVGGCFTVKVGAKSSAECSLAGARIEVADETGVVIGSGTLGNEPWPGTSALVWTEVTLVAPAEERGCSWSVKCVADDPALDDVSGRFSFSTSLPPECLVEIVAVVKDSESAVRNAEVALGRHRGTTDDAGVVRLAVRKGSYDLVVWKVGYQIAERRVDVTQDVTITLEAVALPSEEPDDLYADLYTF